MFFGLFFCLFFYTLMSFRAQMQSDPCLLLRSWCLLWTKKSGVISATPNSNTWSRWANIKQQTVLEKPDAKWLVHAHIWVTAHSVAGFTGPGPAGCLLRLHSIWKSNHQTEEAASRHLCSTSNAAGLLQNAQKVWLDNLTISLLMFEI